ncbi:MAG: hypothetical protein JWN17_2464, partial [Frankiales bacterium]|nr:hypothetical protein [Frankiales bacterium]
MVVVTRRPDPALPHATARTHTPEGEPVNEMDEIVQEFLVESHENLDQLDTDLIALEQDPTSR